MSARVIINSEDAEDYGDSGVYSFGIDKKHRDELSAEIDFDSLIKDVGVKDFRNIIKTNDIWLEA